MGHWTPTGVEPKDYDDDDNEDSKLVTAPFPRADSQSLPRNGSRRAVRRRRHHDVGARL